VARLSEQLSSARFATLQAQLNPHFLFNTLNTITVLVRDGDRQGAVSIIEHLSEVLRRTLTRIASTKSHSVKNWSWSNSTSPSSRHAFPIVCDRSFVFPVNCFQRQCPASRLQHLVENAIRHGIAKHTDAGLLVITAERIARGVNDHCY
jgi:LytS/YehU family sensor histidine kinase